MSNPPITLPPPPWSRAGAALVAAVVGFAAAVRAAAMANDLWLDEVFTLGNVAALKTPAGIFTQFLSDNNHPLISLWIYAVGPTQHEWLYRLPSWLAGVAAVWLAAAIGRRLFHHLEPDSLPANAEAAGVIAATLTAAAYMLTLYFSEARGYGMAVACALVGVFALLSNPAGNSNRWMFAYWLAAVVGLLGHATMVHVLAGGCAWSVARALEARERKSAWLAAARWHGVPLGFALFYYTVFVRHLVIGGGPDTTALTVIGDTAGYTFGAPSVALGLLVSLLVVASLVGTAKRSREVTALFATMIIFAPFATIVFGKFSLLFPRYLIFAAVGAILLATYFLALAWCRGRGGRFAALVIVATILVGNSLPTVELLRHGRGDFRALLRYLALHSHSTEVSVCTDHDNRTLPLIQHYGPIVLPERPIRFVRGNTLRRHAAQWLIVVTAENAARGTEVRDSAGNLFTLEAKFPHGPLSGWDWVVYRDRSFPTP